MKKRMLDTAMRLMEEGLIPSVSEVAEAVLGLPVHRGNTGAGTDPRMDVGFTGRGGTDRRTDQLCLSADRDL